MRSRFGEVVTRGELIAIGLVSGAVLVLVLLLALVGPPLRAVDGVSTIPACLPGERPDTTLCSRPSGTPPGE